MSTVRERNRPGTIWLGGGLVLLLALLYNFIGLAKTPPGLDRDAAANGWMALNWLRYGIFPFWMPHASAPEPLIVWLQTATTALLGPSVAALRSASALFLSLAALVVYFLTLEVAKPFPPVQRFWAALLAGIVFACNPVVTQLARTGLRATTLPLISGLFFLALLRAWRSNARRDYAVSGLLLGVAAYTYLAARFLPVVVVVFVVVAWWVEARGRRIGRSGEDLPATEEGDSSSQTGSLWARNDMQESKGQNRARWIGLALMVGVALVVVLPQVVFFAVYPAAFLERAQSVSLLANPAYQEMGLVKVLAQKALALALMFGISWSGQYNQAQWPLLTPVAFVGLLLSLPLVVRWRRHTAMLLMIVAWLIMLLPDLIGGDRLLPHELRTIGIYVPTMVLSGIGLGYGLGWLLRARQGNAAWTIGGGLLALLIAAWGIVGWFGFSTPALAKSNFDWFARPDVAMAEAINGHEQPLLVPLNDFSRSVVAYLSAKRVQHLQSGIDANGEVVLPSAQKALLLWPADPQRTRVESTSYRFDPTSLVLVDGDHAYLMPPAQGDVEQLQKGCGGEKVALESGEVAGILCEVNIGDLGFPEGVFTATWKVGDLYDNSLRLGGIDAVTTTLSPAMNLGVTSYWLAEEHTNKRWRYFVHLLDDHQNLVAGDDLLPGYGVYETPLWQGNEIVPVQQALRLPQQLAPGRYWLEVGLYDPLNGKRAKISGSDADRSLVGPLKVPLQESTILTSATSLDAQFGDQIAVDGYRLEHNGGGLAVTLQLAALRRPDHDYTVFLHVEDPSGKLVAQSDAQPRDGQYPTSIWDAGEQVVSEWQIALPTSLAAGKYRVWLGLYDGQSGERLPVEATGATVDDKRLLLEEIDLP